jgi:hypothetical protein
MSNLAMPKVDRKLMSKKSETLPQKTPKMSPNGAQMSTLESIFRTLAPETSQIPPKVPNMSLKQQNMKPK